MGTEELEAEYRRIEMGYGETRENYFNDDNDYSPCPRCGEPMTEFDLLANGLDEYGRIMVIHDDCVMEGDPDWEDPDADHLSEWDTENGEG